MEEDDDDFYGGGGGDAKQEQTDTEGDEKDERMDDSEDGEDDDDSDDDVQINLERTDGAKPEPPTGSKAARQQHQQQKDTATSAIKSETTKSSTPVKSEAPRAGSTAPPTAVKGTLTHNGKEGKEFPGVHSSTLDVNGTPTWPPNGKPITAVDIDADLAENSKPWRLPGTDQTDYFNYGFDEYTWVQYCTKQQTMGGHITQIKQDDANMKAFMGAGGGMPDMNDPQGMEQMMQMMMGGGMPGMPGMGGMPNMPGMGGGPQMGGQQGFGGQQGGFGGSGNNSVSPQPNSGQGFKPPQGPGGAGQQGGFDQQGMEAQGWSPQQIAMMQQEQQQQQGGYGGGGGRGRGRRGRGW